MLLRLNDTEQLVHVLAELERFQITIGFCPEHRTVQKDAVQRIVARQHLSDTFQIWGEKRCSSGVVIKYKGSRTEAAQLLSTLLIEGLGAREIEYDFEY